MRPWDCHISTRLLSLNKASLRKLRNTVADNVTDSSPGFLPNCRRTDVVRYTYGSQCCRDILGLASTYCPGDEDCIITMCCVEIASIEDAYCIITVLRQVIEELNEADFVVDFQFRSRRHLANTKLFSATSTSDLVPESVRDVSSVKALTMVNAVAMESTRDASTREDVIGPFPASFHPPCQRAC